MRTRVRKLPENKNPLTINHLHKAWISCANKTVLSCLIFELYLEVVLKELLAVYLVSKKVVATKFFLKSRIASLTEHIKTKELVGILDKRRNLAIRVFI